MRTLQKDDYGFTDSDYDKGIEVDNEIKYVGVSTGKEDNGKDIFYDGPNACWLTPSTELLGYWSENTEEAIKSIIKNSAKVIKDYIYTDKKIEDFTNREKEIIAAFIEHHADEIYDAPSHYRWVAFSIRWLYLGERERVLAEREK